MTPARLLPMLFPNRLGVAGAGETIIPDRIRYRPQTATPPAQYRPGSAPPPSQYRPNTAE